KRLGVVHGDVGEHLAIDLHARLVEAMDQLGVAQALAARRGVDAHDPKPPEVALARAAIAVGVPSRAHDLLVGEPVARVLATPVAPRLSQHLLPAALARA